jgi:predicted ATPase with chaperone activity
MAAGIKRRRFANGPPRPTYLTGVDADRAVMMILALASEVSALRERLDSHEQLAASGSLPTPESVEAHEPTAAVEARRAAARRAMIDRITRVLLEPESQRVRAANEASE